MVRPTGMIAALYVASRGCYFGLPGVDPWDEARDARLYVGPHPVVAHPPCERWGRYWHGGPSAKVRRVKGDDGGWVSADGVGWTCHVEQGHYGHRARKATWLYAVSPALPALAWGPSASSARLDAGYHSAAERRAKGGIVPGGRRLTARECLATPPAFRDILLSIAMNQPHPEPSTPT